MTKQKKIEQLEYILIRDNYTCRTCGKSVNGLRPQRAHHVSDTIVNKKIYGEKIIDSLDNVALACSLTCNKQLDLGRIEYWQIRAVEIFNSYNPESERIEMLDKLIKEKRGKEWKQNTEYGV